MADVNRDEPISVEEHRTGILALARPLGVETAPVGAALGRALAGPVVARLDVPLFDCAAMDGFAVGSGDAGRHAGRAGRPLRISADLPAGAPLDQRLASGEAARIMTGAALPAGADAVVPIEQVAAGADPDERWRAAGGVGDDLALAAIPPAGTNVRRAGEDCAAGETVASRGPLGPAHLAALTAAGVTEVPVRRRPRVAVLTTGSELAPAGETPLDGRIPETNSLLLGGMLADAGVTDVRFARAPDDPVALRAAVARLTRGRDLLILTGGVGPGARDVVRAAFTGELRFVRVAMRPGSPQASGMLHGVPTVALPGNPVAVAASFAAFVRPLLRRLAGDPPAEPARVLAAEPLTGRPGRRTFLPVRVVAVDPLGRRTVAPVRPSGSHRIVALSRADGFAVLSPEHGTIPRGGLAAFEPL